MRLFVVVCNVNYYDEAKALLGLLSTTIRMTLLVGGGLFQQLT